MLIELSRKGIVMLTYLYNAILRLNYWPKQLKVAEIILISKLGKNPNHVSSYRPISLLSTISKLLEKLLLPKIVSLLDVIPQHQFGFRHSNSTIQQCHRVVHEINKTLENKKILFLCISRHKPGLRQGMAWQTPLQNKTPSSILLQTTSILPMRSPVQNKSQWRNLGHIPNQIRGVSGKRPWPSALSIVYIRLTNN
jgi:hypothetical protein